LDFFGLKAAPAPRCPNRREFATAPWIKAMCTSLLQAKVRSPKKTAKQPKGEHDSPRLDGHCGNEGKNNAVIVEDAVITPSPSTTM